MLSLVHKISASANAILVFVVLSAVAGTASVGMAADVTLAWDANTEPDLNGYILYYGTASRNQEDYAHNIDVGNVTSHTVTGLSDGQTYYFAASAYDTNGNESAYSVELSHSVGSQPSPLDSDGDGLSDEDERDVYGTNPNNADSDGDGLSDGAEINTHHTDPLTADSDGDGLADPNELSAGTNPNDTDSDNDGLSDGAEVNTYHTDPLAVDTDGDGLADPNELSAGTNPNDTDSDNDGLSDGAEVNTHHTDPLAADTDGDGLDDGQEIADGSDPLRDDPPSTSPPNPPALVVPNDGEVDVTLTPVLVTEEFSDPDPGDTHAGSHWQISTDSDFNYLIFDLFSERFLTTLPLHESILSRDTTYYWRVRFTDDHNMESEWSRPFSFSTIVESDLDQNLNGIPDAQEVLGATDLDENQIDDTLQSDIICINTFVGDSAIGLKWSNNVTMVETLSSSDGTEISETFNRPARLPYGLISFKLYLDHPGDTAEITFMFSEPVPDGLRWIKYDLAEGWHDFTPHVLFSVNRKKLVLTLTDGGAGDADGVVNGVIVDPSAITRSDTNDTTTSLRGASGGDEPAPSKASCFIGSAAETHSGVNLATWGRRSWMFTLLGCLFSAILALSGYGCIRKSRSA